jgi:hypothetical protein
MTGRLIALRRPVHRRVGAAASADFDHVVATPSGVWVIDARSEKGRVARKDVGGLLGSDVRLYVGGRDRTELVPATWKQVAAVRTGLGHEWAEVPIRPMLCFVDADWGRLARPFELHGVHVTWPSAARELLARPGSYPTTDVERIASALEERLRPAS